MFRSFYLAGFECATGYNMHGEWIDQIVATEHDHRVNEDYARLAEIDIHGVREAVRWPLVDRGGGRYDFSSLEPFVDAARRHGFDVIWDLFHYGYPDGVDPFSSELVERFGAYCRAVARFLSERLPGPHFFTPINEPSYFSWVGGHAAHFAPYERNRGIELKINLARACLRGIDALREVCPTARIVNVDPICHVVPRNDSREELEAAHEFNEHTIFQFWDLVSGREMPELGGRLDCLDVVGVNYYWTNQWELGSEGTPLADDDPRRLPLAELVRRVWDRYHTDVVITETSALGEARAPWVHELASMAERLLAQGVALRGVCLYPILGMPEWHARDEWTRMGLWDLEHRDDRLERKIFGPMLDALRVAQGRNASCEIGRPRTLTLAHDESVVHGALVALRAESDYQLRLIRADQPRRMWLANVGLRDDDGWVHGVSTALELPTLLEELRALDLGGSWTETLDGLAAELAPRTFGGRS
jgi:hypothetical protein